MNGNGAAIGARFLNGANRSQMVGGCVPIGGLLDRIEKSVFVSGRGCSLMFAWDHRLVPRLAKFEA
jgi:hypothetical protein